MGGMVTLDTASAAVIYGFLSDRIESSEGNVSIYSRLPMRQLLRFVASNKAEMWWISDHEDPRSVAPTVGSVEKHINTNLTPSQDLLIVEGLDWLVSRSGVQDTLAWLQQLHGQAVEHDFDVVLPLDSLSMETHVWRRVAALAPVLEQPGPEEESLEEHDVDVQNEPLAVLDEPQVMDDDRTVTHLVSLPFEGFTKSLLSKRMLQWKRMGFDLASLEPALSMNDLDKLHALYASVESTILLAIDGLRLMEYHRGKLSVTEREMFNYRMMSLTDVEHHIGELEATISSR